MIKGEIQIGKKYIPDNPSNSGCGNYDSNHGAYVIFTNAHHYNIFDSHGKVVDTCYSCLRKNNLHAAAFDPEFALVGDIIQEPAGAKRYVMGRVGKIVFLSDFATEAENYGDVSCFAIKELKDWTGVEDTPSETVEIDGKKFDKEQLLSAIKNLTPTDEKN